MLEVEQVMRVCQLIILFKRGFRSYEVGQYGGYMPTDKLSLLVRELRNQT